MDLLPKPKERSFQEGTYTPGIHAMILLAPGTAPGALLYAGCCSRPLPTRPA